MEPFTLIIPDLHTQHEWVEPAIEELRPSKVVFLGDYFDGDRPDVDAQRRTAEWLRDSLLHPNRVHLLGNHDVHYAYWENPASRYDEHAHPIINETLGDGWGEKLHLHHREQGWLLTHAGLHPELWPGSHAGFDALCVEARAALRERRWHPLLNCGKDRGGSGLGGLLWLDFHWSFKSIPHVPQIVGHTRCLLNPRQEGALTLLDPENIIGEDGTENWNLDTRCAWLGTLVNGAFAPLENRWQTRFRARTTTSFEK